VVKGNGGNTLYVEFREKGRKITNKQARKQAKVVGTKIQVYLDLCVILENSNHQYDVH
jgi:hypothetical protein